MDRWLQEHKLDRYGNAEGTMYTGGTPLFNEATGESRDRLEYVFERQPEARKACARQGRPVVLPHPACLPPARGAGAILGEEIPGNPAVP